MNDSERPDTPATPENVWKSIDGKEGNVNITFTPDQLCAMAHSRERLSIWSRRILLILWIALAGVCAYRFFAVSQLWARLSLGWFLAWFCLLIWKHSYTPRRMSRTESCANFLRREFEGKRGGLLEMQRYVLLLIPPITASWWGPGMRALRLSRLKALGVDPSSRLYEFANGPWPFLIIFSLLVLDWLAFGLAAKKAGRELDELRRRTQE